VYLEDYGQAQKAVALYLSGQIEALPRQIRQQLPHLTLHDEEVIEDLVRRLLNRVADWRLDDGEVDE
jgi:phage terminase Nu1 subunit (DNA packaging protein)